MNERFCLQVGYINCEKYTEFCKDHKMWPLKTTKLRLFSFRSGGLVTSDYSGKWSEKDVKNYCVETLPKFSLHVESIESLNAEIEEVESSPSAVLLTKKKAASAIWLALSRLFHGRIHFFDLQVCIYWQTYLIMVPCFQWFQNIKRVIQ